MIADGPAPSSALLLPTPSPPPASQWVTFLTPICFVFPSPYLFDVMCLLGGCNPVGLGGWRCKTGLVHQRRHLHLRLAHLSLSAVHQSPPQGCPKQIWRSLVEGDPLVVGLCSG